ncbi:MAG TPA: serine hydrolase domain-containing protein [Candidatus Acidoferrum sp.]|nr:serine hydrolase domain-containing protein [Candidatus Acidoferrum sp.]
MGLFCRAIVVAIVCASFAVKAQSPHSAIAAKTASSTKEEKPPAAAAPITAHALERSDLEGFFDGIIPLQLERSDVAGASVLVMKDGKDLLRKGYGYADIAKKKPVDPETTMFRLASISKLFTWVSVMQLAEQGKLDINADVNKYLDFQIAPAFGKPITLRNLMTHTGGFEEEIRDIILTDPKQAMPLREFLIENQPRRIFPPGEVPAYSNYGVGLGGYVVQRVSGEPFEQYVSEHIFLPLEMKHSSFKQPLAEDLSPFPSDGYRSDTEKPAVGFEIFNPAPAGGVSSTASDMGRFAQALLNAGEWEGHRILKTETLNTMWTRQFGASDALPAMCMGFYQTWRNGLRFVGHGGDLIAFHSIFLLEPKEKLAIFVSYNSAGSANKTRTEILNAFADRYYPYSKKPEFQKFTKEELKTIAGTYQATRRSESNKLKIGSLIGQGEVNVDKDGVLKIEDFKDLRGHTRQWKPIGKDLWHEVDEQGRMFAVRDNSGRIARLAVSFPGVQYERVPWYENSQAILPILMASLVILAAVVAASLLRLGRRILFSNRPAFKQQPGSVRLTLGSKLAATAWIVLCVGTGILMSRLENESVLPTHAIDKYFVMMNLVTGVAILLSLFAVFAGLRIWRLTDVRFISKLKFSLVALACVFLTWFSVHWHLIGPAHRF